MITLTTDFGNRDGFVGILKGIIWGICPGALIADISHEIAPQDVAQGAIVLSRAAPFFSAGTVHLAVVDPGVGTGRRALAARIGAHYFVGPDNGLCTPLVEAARGANLETAFVTLDNPACWLPNVSRTFHGRDIFAPVAARLAAGVTLEDLGTLIHDPVLTPAPAPERIPGGWRARVAAVDTFGNLSTNLRAAEVSGPGLLISIKDRHIRGLSASFGEHQPGELIALVDSDNRLALAQVNGSAARALGAGVGDEVVVLFVEPD